MSIIISLDIGTSKLCAVAYCTKQRRLLEDTASENASLLEDLPTGHHEQSPQAIWASALSLLRDLLASEAVDASAVSGIVITGQMHGLLLVDPEGIPVTNLITWRDQRASDIASHFDRRYADQNGCPLRRGYGGATLAYWAQSQRNLLAGSVTALSICDYVCAKLSGVSCSEATHAASWGLYDLRSRQWNLPLVRELAIPETVLPELKPTTGPLGVIVRSVAAQLGLRPDVVVYSPIGDNQAAVIGARGGACDVAVLNLGTGGQISIPRKECCSVAGFETRPMPDGSYLLVGASICGGWTYAYLKNFFKDVVKTFAELEMSDRDVYAKMNHLLESGVGTSELHVAPWFCGTRANPQAQGAITNIGTDNLTVNCVTRAFAESMVEELRAMTPAPCDGDFSSIVASGNAVRKNPAILSIITQCFGKTASLAPYREEAAVGAAIASQG